MTLDGPPTELAGRVRALADGRPGRLGNAAIAGGFRARPSYRPNDPARPTVCLVHGINSTSGSFVHLVPELERAGYGVVLYDFPFNRDLDESAAAFADAWRAFRDEHGEHRPWAIVGHSMGALLARSYVEGPDYGDDVAALILIGPPNEGSAMAKAQGLLQWIEGFTAAREGAGAGPGRPERRHRRGGRGPVAGQRLPRSAGRIRPLARASLTTSWPATPASSTPRPGRRIEARYRTRPAPGRPARRAWPGWPSATSAPSSTS